MPVPNYSNTDGVGLAAKALFFKEAGKLIKLQRDLARNYLTLGKLAVVQGFNAANKEMEASMISGVAQTGGAAYSMKKTFDMGSNLKTAAQNNMEKIGIQRELGHINDGRGAIVTAQDGTFAHPITTSSGTVIRNEPELKAHISQLEHEKRLCAAKGETLSGLIGNDKETAQAFSIGGQGAGQLLSAIAKKDAAVAQVNQHMAQRADTTDKGSEDAVNRTLSNITQARLYVSVAV